MTAMTPSNMPTEVLTVNVATIRQDPSWPIDPTLVTSFRASITRGEPPLLDLSLNRMRNSDGTVELEIIDGMHRLEALRLEGVEEHSAFHRIHTDIKAASGFSHGLTLSHRSHQAFFQVGRIGTHTQGSLHNSCLPLLLASCCKQDDPAVAVMPVTHVPLTTA